MIALLLTVALLAHAAQPCPSYLDVAARFGTYPGSAVSEAGYHYSGLYDLNKDLRINVQDIILAELCAGEASDA